MFTTLCVAVALAQPCPEGICRPRLESATPHGAIVRVMNERGRERTFASGSVVETDDEGAIVVTAGHLFREYTGRVTVQFSDSETCAAELLDVDEQHDLAALRVDAGKRAALSIATQPPRPGDALTSCGYGPDGRFAVSRGQALGYVSLDGRAADVLELSGAARQGDSGGPILNAAEELAGVLFGTDGKRVDGAHCGTVREFIARWRTAKPQAGENACPGACGFARVEPRLARLEAAQQQINSQLAVMLRKSGAPCPCDPTLRDRIAQLEASRLAPPIAKDLPRVSEDAARFGGGLSWVLETFVKSKLTAVLVGFGLPGGVAALGTWLVMRRAKKRLRAIVLHDQSAPLPQVVERERQFVEVQVPTDRQGALEWAMDEYVKRNPGARPTVETIEAYAKQFQSATRRSV